MNSKSTYIPDKLFLYRKDQTYKYEVFGIGPDGKSLIPSINSENNSWRWGDLRTILNKYGDKVYNGDLPEEIKNQVKIVPNTPFRLKVRESIFDSEDNVSEDREVFYLEFSSHGSGEIVHYSINNINKNISLIRLGLDRGEILRDCVVAFTYTFVRSATTEPWDEMVFIESSGPYYENIQKRSEWIREKYCSSLTNFEVGRVYQMKGKVQNVPESGDGCKPRQAVYLGKLNFANNTITGGENPGKKYTRIDTWMWLDQWLNPYRKAGAPISIFTCDPSAVLSISYDFPAALSLGIINEVINRFEKSMWSAKFWKSPGIVKDFSPILDRDIILLKDWEKTTETFTYNNCTSSHTFWEKDIFTKYPSQSLKTVVKVCASSSNWPSRIDLSGTSNKNWLPVEISCQDPLSPIKITPHSEKLGSSGLSDWLGGEEWISNPEHFISSELLKRRLGMKYTTRDGYIFYQVLDIITSHRASLYKTPPTLYASYRQWTICGKIEP